MEHRNMTAVRNFGDLLAFVLLGTIASFGLGLLLYLEGPEWTRTMADLMMVPGIIVGVTVFWIAIFKAASCRR